MKRTIAIVGGGIGGLTAAYLLNRKHDITLFEKDSRLGGCAYTHQTSSGEMIEIGAINVINPPAMNFFRLCDELNVRMVRRPAASLISIHDLDKNDGVYPTMLSLKGLLTQRLTLFRSLSSKFKPFWFMQQAEKLKDKGKLNGLSLRDTFKLLPELSGQEQASIIATFTLALGTDYEDILEVSVEYLVDFYKAYGRFNPISFMARTYYPRHLTQSYVEALASPYRDRVVLNSKIRKVVRNDERVELKMEDGKEAVFDKIVFACNADQALALLETPTKEENRLLGTRKYREILTIVHKDNSSLPARELCQAWLVIQRTRKAKPSYSISCCSWLLPGVSQNSEYVSTLNPNFSIKEDLIDFQTNFRVPLYDLDSCSTIKELPCLNGNMNSYYCGAYFGNNVHGDTVDSAVEVAKHLGIDWT